MKKEILLWMLLAWQTTPSFSNWSNDISIKDTRQEIVNTFSSKKNQKNTYQISAPKILEALQNNSKEQIIKGVLAYFDHDVTFTLTPKEKEQLKWQLNIYINKYPNIVYSNWNNILLNLNDNNFRELFSILLPYLWRWKELNKYPPLIRNNSNLIINHVTKAKWSEAEKYFFRQFGNLIRRIVEQKWWFMTIWYYRQEMLKIIPNKYITNKEYPSEILNSDIRSLPKFFQP